MLTIVIPHPLCWTPLLQFAYYSLLYKSCSAAWVSPFFLTCLLFLFFSLDKITTRIHRFGVTVDTNRQHRASLLGHKSNFSAGGPTSASCTAVRPTTPSTATTTTTSPPARGVATSTSATATATTATTTSAAAVFGGRTDTWGTRRVGGGLVSVCFASGRRLRSR